MQQIFLVIFTEFCKSLFKVLWDFLIVIFSHKNLGPGNEICKDTYTTHIEDDEHHKG